MKLLPSGLPQKVSDSEDLSRFLTSSSSDFAASKGIVKPRAFLPNPKNLETSVFRLGAEPADALWDMADREMPSGRTVYGAGIVAAGSVLKADLEVTADEDPPNGPKQANIVGWPPFPDDPEVEKSVWKDRANVIAKNAKLILR